MNSNSVCNVDLCKKAILYGVNGVLKGHFHGTRDMSIQVNTILMYEQLVQNYMMSQLLPRLQSEAKLKFQANAGNMYVRKKFIMHEFMSSLHLNLLCLVSQMIN